MTPAEIDDLLIEPMARAMCIAQKRAPDAPRWVHAGTHETCGVCWHENIDAVRAALAAQRITLKSAGLFIGPEVATEVMLAAVKPFPAHLVPADPNDPKHIAMRAATMVDQLSVKTLWRELVAEWQRGGGA